MTPRLFGGLVLVVAVAIGVAAVRRRRTITVYIDGSERLTPAAVVEALERAQRMDSRARSAGAI